MIEDLFDNKHVSLDHFISSAIDDERAKIRDESRTCSMGVDCLRRTAPYL